MTRLPYLVSDGSHDIETCGINIQPLQYLFQPQNNPDKNLLIQVTPNNGYDKYNPSYSNHNIQGQRNNR